MDFTRCVAIAAAVAALMPSGVRAQAQAGDDAAAAASPLAPLYAQFDETLPSRLIGADDAASRWLSGRLSALEPSAQIRDYAAAVAREPKEMLYVASLADACMGVGAMLPRDCTDRDPVGYWVSRDTDNAVPWLLQAERARRRNNVPSLIDNLDRASKSSRYATYQSRAAPSVWNKLAPLVPSENRGAAALYALDARQASDASLVALENLCSPASRGLDARIGAACLRLAILMAERAPLFADRRAGTQLALNLASEGGKAVPAEQARAVVAQQDRCREAVNALRRFALGTPSQRDRAGATASEFLSTRAREGEPAACAALATAMR
jgi:hypothetical protein